MDKILDGLYLGQVAAAADEKLMRDHNITHVLSLGVWPTALDPKIKNLKLSIQDHPSCPIYPLLDKCADFISDCLRSNGKILVHW
jgi:hypothetical protein